MEDCEYHHEFTFDGKTYSRMDPTKLPQGAKWVFDHPFFLLLNLAVGGQWPGNPDESTQFPRDLVVDWIRVWEDTPPAVPQRQ